MQTLISIRMDETLKNNFDYVCSELGMTMSTAVTIFANKVCREKRIPFDVSIDPAYENKTKGNTKMTKFRVYIFPEVSDAFESIEKTFNTFEEAYSFLEKNVLKIQEELYHQSPFSLCFYAVEMLDPSSLDTHLIRFCDDSNYILTYKKNGIDNEIKLPVHKEHEEDGYAHEEILQTIKNFVTSLQTAGVI